MLLMTERLLTVAETAAMLGVSTAKVHELVRNGTLTAIPNALDKRRRLIAAEQVEALAQRFRVELDR